jgi:NAD(P)H-hydrate epimerase
MYSKVVTVEEMVRVEKWAIERGASQEAFMAEAGRKVAFAVEELHRGKRVALLIGKGNKGGDGYAAGMELLKRGYQVRALCMEAASELNQLFRKRFERAGGVVCLLEGKLDFTQDDLLIDALLGTGFRGEVEEGLGRVIDTVNQLKKPIVSIDLPSGLNGTTGEASRTTIAATMTVTLGFPKMGLFSQAGWNHTGTLRIESFGLSEEAVSQAKASALIPVFETLSLPPMVRTQHKYQRGFVLGFGGSAALKGAPKLSGLAALHAGAGIVKLFSLEDIGPTANELIAQVFEETAWQESLAKAQAVFIGPGLGRSPQVKEWLKAHLSQIKQPCVLDADALFFLPEITAWPARAILTPHRGEMSHLLGPLRPVSEWDYLTQCQKFVDAKQAIIILKGAPTFILSPHKLPILITRGDPGMATAGSGDVLTGILASLLAQGKEPLDASVLATTLHALTGEIAAAAKTSHGYTATDLIERLPEALANIMQCYLFD